MFTFSVCATQVSSLAGKNTLLHPTLVRQGPFKGASSALDFLALFGSRLSTEIHLEIPTAVGRNAKSPSWFLSTNMPWAWVKSSMQSNFDIMLPCAKLLKPGNYTINGKISVGEVWNFSSFCSQRDRRCRRSWTNKRTVKHCQKDGGQQNLGHQSPPTKKHHTKLKLVKLEFPKISKHVIIFVNPCLVCHNVSWNFLCAHFLPEKNHQINRSPQKNMPKKPENVAAHVPPWGANSRGYTDSLWRL